MNTSAQPAAKKHARNVCPQVSVSVMEDLTPQARVLFHHLNVHGSVTQREAMIELGVQSLTKRVSELRKHFIIVSDIRIHKTTQQRYCRYFLKGVKPVKQVAVEVARPMPDLTSLEREAA